MSKNLILDKLEGVKERFQEVGRLITDPDTISDMKRYIKLNKEYKDLEPIIRAYDAYKNVLSNIQSAKEILGVEKDPEMREMAKEELDELLGNVSPMEEKIQLLLIPKDPEDTKNALMEIRAGAGGDEASIFAGDLQRMYMKYAETRAWKVELG